MNLLELARAALEAGRAQEALRWLQRHLAEFPDDPEANCEIALVGCYMGREDEAERLFPLTEGASRRPRLARVLRDFNLARGTDASAYSSVAEPSAPVGTSLTAVMIVRDEAENLPRCLVSLEGVVNEIIVVDTGSDDDTAEIAEMAGARVFHHPWADDFAEARNVALSHATGDWILWIDADEELDPGSLRALGRGLVRPQFGGYQVEIANLVEGEDPNAAFMHYPVRLFRRLPGVGWKGRIHEQVEESIRRTGFPIARLEGARLIHHGYRESAMRERSKIDRNLAMIRAALAEQPDDGFQWFNLANTCLVGGQFAEAVRAARKGLESPDPGGEVRRLTHHLYVQSLARTDRLDDALEAADEAETELGPDLLIEFERAQVLLRQDRLEEAERSTARSLTLPWREGSTGDRGIATHKRYVLRAQVMLALGMVAEAEEALRPAAEHAPDYPFLRLVQGRLAGEAGRFEEALDHLGAAMQHPASRRSAESARADILVAMGRAPEAIGWLEAAWREHPEDEGAWVRWVSACETAGDASAVLAAYAAWHRLHEPTASTMVNTGRALAAVGQIDRALECFSDAMYRNPADPNPCFNAGDLLYAAERWVDAAHMLQQGLRLRPDHAEGWFVLGNALAQLGLDEQAVGCYLRTLELSPNHEPARANLRLVSDSAAA